MDHVCVRKVFADASLPTFSLQYQTSSIERLRWVAFAPGADKPTIETIADWNRELTRSRRAQQGVEEPTPQWVERMMGLGFSHVDDLDLAVARVIENGFVEGTRLREVCIERDRSARNDNLLAPLKQVWGNYYGSFSTDDAIFTAQLIEASTQAIPHMAIGDLSASAILLRRLNRADEADALIERYIAAHGDTPDLFDLSNHPFAGEIHDERLRARFAQAFDASRTLPTLADSVRFIAQQGGYNPEHLQVMREASVGDYYSLFTSTHGRDELSSVIRTCLRWAGGDHAAITERAREALRLIGDTGEVNRQRVAEYGIR